MSDLLDSLLVQLRAQADPQRASKEKAYLKSELEHIGVPAKPLRSAVRALAKTELRERDELLALTDEMWTTGIHELRTGAVDLVDFRSKWLLPEDLKWLEVWVRQARTWAYVDSLAVHTIGAVFGRFPELEKDLDRWATDADFWVRRSALLVNIKAIRKGPDNPAFSESWERFVRYAEPQLEDKEFFIRKAIGWVAREMATRDPKGVVAWLKPRWNRVSGLTRKEAIRKLPESDRQQLPLR